MSSRNLSSSTSSSKNNGRSKSHDEIVNEVVATSLGTDEQSAVIIKYILMAVGALAVLKIVSQSIMYLSLAASPLMYGYFKATCPDTSTFDSKEELKPVLEGRHLPPAQQESKSSWEKLFSSAKASVTAEYSALIGDTQVEFTNIFGVAIVAKVTCQQQTYYWIGARHEWKFVYTNAPNNESVTVSTKNIRNVNTNSESLTESMTRRGSTVAAAAAAAAVAAISNSTASRPGNSKKSI